MCSFGSPYHVSAVDRKLLWVCVLGCSWMSLICEILDQVTQIAPTNGLGFIQLVSSLNTALRLIFLAALEL